MSVLTPRALALVRTATPRALSLVLDPTPRALILVHTALHHDVPDVPRPSRTPRPWPHLVSVTPAVFLVPPLTPRALVLVLPLAPVSSALVSLLPWPCSRS